MFALAKYTLLESIRDRIYLGFLTGLVILTTVFVLVGASPWGLTNNIVERLGWMAVDVMICLLTSIYVVTNLFREYERKILYSHLTLPLGRNGYILGKTLGYLAALTALAMLGAAIILLGDRYLTFLTSMPWQVTWLVPSVILKCSVLIGFAVLLTQLTTSSLTATLFTLGIYLLGNGADDLIALAAGQPTSVQYALQFVYYIVPNLQLLDFEHAALYGGGVGMVQLGQALLYAGCYTTAPLVLACMIFGKKDL